MTETKKLGSVRRLGARYGRKVKHRLAEIESVQRKKHVCPYCKAKNVKRISVGIWGCKKCDSKFTGKAYTLSKEVVRE